MFGVTFRPYLSHMYSTVLLPCTSSINHAQATTYRPIINRIYRCKTICASTTNRYLSSDNRTPGFMHRYDIMTDVISPMYGTIGTSSGNPDPDPWRDRRPLSRPCGRTDPPRPTRSLPDYNPKINY